MRTQAGDSLCRRERSDVARRRHHIRGRRLARRERGRERISTGQRGGHRERRGRTQCGISFEAPENHPFDGWVDVGDHARGAGRRQPIGDPRESARDLKRRLACEHFVQDQAEGVDVGPCRGLVTGELFRRHVRGRAGEDVGIVPFVRQTREAEVGDAHATSPVDEHVGRFQIAVQYAAIMGGSQTRAELPRQFERLVRWQSSNAPQKRGKILAVHVLHREEVLAVRLADVVDTAHVRMGHLARDADFVLEARQAVRAVDHVFGQELESHRLTELEILGPIHIAHAAAAEKADDPVAAGEHRAGNEPRLVERFGRVQQIMVGPGDRGRG